MSRFLAPAIMVGLLALALDMTFHQILSFILGPQPHMITNLFTEPTTPQYFTSKFLAASASALIGFSIFRGILSRPLFTAAIFTALFLSTVYLLGLSKYYSLFGFYHIGHFLIVFTSAYVVNLFKGK